QVGEQGVGGDVEGDAEEHVGGALVELAGEPPAGHVELGEGVAGGRAAGARHLGGGPGGGGGPAGRGGVGGGRRGGGCPARRRRTRWSSWSKGPPRGQAQRRHCWP